MYRLRRGGQKRKAEESVEVMVAQVVRDLEHNSGSTLKQFLNLYKNENDALRILWGEISRKIFISSSVVKIVGMTLEDFLIQSVLDTLVDSLSHSSLTHLLRQIPKTHIQVHEAFLHNDKFIQKYKYFDRVVEFVMMLSVPVIEQIMRKFSVELVSMVRLETNNTFVRENWEKLLTLYKRKHPTLEQARIAFYNDLLTVNRIYALVKARKVTDEIIPISLLGEEAKLKLDLLLNRSAPSSIADVTDWLEYLEDLRKVYVIPFDHIKLLLYNVLSALGRKIIQYGPDSTTKTEEDLIRKIYNLNDDIARTPSLVLKCKYTDMVRDVLVGLQYMSGLDRLPEGTEKELTKALRDFYADPNDGFWIKVLAVT